MLTGIKWLQIAIGAVAGFALCWLIHLVILAGVEETHGKALNDQKTQLEAQCAEHKAITERANDDLQNEYAAIARKLADAQRLHPPVASCQLPGRPSLRPAGENMQDKMESALTGSATTPPSAKATAPSD